MTNSTFYGDGFRDAKNGLPPSPPAHPQTKVYCTEYMQGYSDGCEELQNSKFNG